MQPGRGRNERRGRHEQQQAHEGEERARVHREEQVEALGHLRGGDQPADEAADAESEVVGDAREGVGGGALLARCQRGEQARVAGRKARVPGAGDQGETERVPGLAHEREAPVAGGEQAQRDHQRRTGAHVVDDVPRERAPDQADPQQHRDHEARGAEAEMAHVVQVDDRGTGSRSRSRASWPRRRLPAARRAAGAAVSGF